MNTLLHDAYQRSLAYQHDLPSRPVFPAPDALAGLDHFDEPLPAAPQSAEETLRLLDEYGSPATVASTGGRYFGFVTGGTLPVALASNWLATTWDQNGALFTTSPVVARIEQIAQQWLVQIFNLPHETVAAFVSGATLANFTALAAARHAILARQGWDVEAQGLFGAPEIRVVLSDEIHVSVLKALGLLGLGRQRVERVPVDDQGRLIVDALPALDDRTIVCLQAGNVNSGAFDPIQAVCERARAAGAWVHVDGAFGLWAAASDALRHLCAGHELADSWTIDAHKWLNVPYDSGIALCRHPQALAAAMATHADYLALSAHREPSHFVPEFSRCARAIDVWAALRTLGRSGLSAMIEKNCRQARRFAQGLLDAGFIVHNNVALNQVVVSFGDQSTTQAVIAAVQRDGALWAGQTVWKGQTAMRISVSSWATTDEDVDHSLAAIIRAATKSQP